MRKDSTVGHSEISLSKKIINRKEQPIRDEQNFSLLSEKSQQKHHKNESTNVWKITESTYFKRKENGNGTEKFKTVNSSHSMANHFRKQKNNKERFEAFGNASRRQESKEGSITVQMYKVS